MKEKKMSISGVFILMLVILIIFSIPCELTAGNCKKETSPISSIECLIAQKASSQNNNLEKSGAQSSGSQKDEKKKESGTKPLKKFVPKEKIKVDTVVDFPIDI